MTEYCLLSDNDPHRFNDSVSAKLKEGWILYGDLQVVYKRDSFTIYWTRELVREVEDPNEVKTEKRKINTERIND